MESARGRWFLEEYARRNRNADTKLVLSAIERLERLVRRDAPAATAAVGGEALPGAHGDADSRDANKSPARSEISALAHKPKDPDEPGRPVSMPMPRAGPSDPLAALKAMTDAERIALFT